PVQVRSVDVVNGDDIGMIQGGRGLGFLHEASSAIGIRQCARQQDLDRNGPVEVCIQGAENNAHTPFAQLALDSIVSEGLAEQGTVRGSSSYGEALPLPGVFR